MIPRGHLLRLHVFVTSVLGDLHEHLDPFYSDIGRPSIAPELLIRMLIIGYCFGIRSERKLCEEVRLHLAYRWFCRLDLNDAVPHHSTFSENRLNRIGESDILRHIFFERVVIAAMGSLVKGEGFAVDASVMEAPSNDPRQDRALASDAQEPDPARELLPAGRISKPRSRPSSPITIICAIMRASAT
jgi:transposase